MTYTASLDPNSRQSVAIDALVDHFDATLPQWDERERFGDTIVSEDDFPLYDASADESRVSNEDWEAFLADRY